jgi:AFG3 family protein
MENPGAWHIKMIRPKQRFNILLFFVVAFLSVFAIPFRGSTQPTITFQRFLDEMLKQHDVERIIAYKSGDLVIAQVYIKKEALDKPEYADAQKVHSVVSTNGGDAEPQYTFAAPTFDSLVKQLNDAQAGVPDAQRVPLAFEQGHESLLSNWFVQCIIMIFLLIVPIVCGILCFNEGKNRTMGPIAGVLLGIFLGLIGLIIVYVSEKKPSKKNGGTWV